jgi:tetratricopeptide (TPR) repeat protein
MVTLEPLTNAESRDMLAGRVDEARITGESQAADALIQFCAGFPLALAVTAAYVATCPRLSLAEIAAELQDEASRLTMMDVGDTTTSVRAVFSWTYKYLSPASARLFRLLALHPGADIAVPAAASLANITLDNSRELLGQLVRMNLLRQQGPGRFAFHDLVRVYARELAENHGSDEREAALSGLFDYYLHTVAVAMDMVFPAETERRPRIVGRPVLELPINGREGALAWLDAERANLTAAAHAGRHDWPGHTTRLAAILFRYLDAGGHFSEAVAIHGVARRAASQTGDKGAEAVALTNLGVACLRRGKDNEAMHYLRQALELYPETGDRIGHARALHNLGVVYVRRDQLGEAAEHIRQALDLHREIGDRVGQVRSLSSLGSIEARCGRHDQAILLQEQALALSRELGDRNGEAYALSYLGELEMHQRRYRMAKTYIHQALTLFRETGDRNGQAGALDDLGRVDLHQDRRAQAESHFRQALTLYREIGDPNGEAEALRGLGEALLAAGLPDAALDQHRAEPFSS